MASKNDLYGLLFILDMIFNYPPPSTNRPSDARYEALEAIFNIISKTILIGGEGGFCF
jgi:hypothetical protein